MYNKLRTLNESQYVRIQDSKDSIAISRSKGAGKKEREVGMMYDILGQNRPQIRESAILDNIG